MPPVSPAVTSLAALAATPPSFTVHVNLRDISSHVPYPIVRQISFSLSFYVPTTSDQSCVPVTTMAFFGAFLYLSFSYLCLCASLFGSHAKIVALLKSSWSYSNNPLRRNLGLLARFFKVMQSLSSATVICFVTKSMLILRKHFFVHKNHCLKF